MQGETDQQLVARARSGAAEAYEALVIRYEPRVTGLCQRILDSRTDAEDAAISAFLKAWRSLARYDASRPFSTWLFTIAVREAVSLARSRRPWAPLEAVGEGASPAPATVATDPESHVLAAEGRQAILDALEQLQPAHRAAIVLRYQLDHSYAEIAEILRIPVGTVGTLLYRAKRQLRRHIEEEAR